MGIKKSDYSMKVKLELATAYEIVNMSPISFYLRLKIEKN